MRMGADCAVCVVNMALKYLNFADADEAQRREAFKRVFAGLARDGYDKSTPETMRDSLAELCGIIGDGDCFFDIKRRFNDAFASRQDGIRSAIASSPDPLACALRMAISGNLIDFAAPNGVDFDKVMAMVDSAAGIVMARDDSAQLMSDLESASRLLYLGDNCGEIVLDKLFIERLKIAYPKLYVTFAVRGSHIINDVTLDDARQCGMDAAADSVIANGDGSPGTVLSRVSGEFKREFEAADVIISKGLGNLESLYGETEANIYYMFMVKCRHVASLLGLETGAVACMKNR